MAEQKTAIITGCSSGIGLATALLFLKKGYRVFGIDRAPFGREKLESSSAKDFQFHKADMVEDGACDAAVKACVEAFGWVLCL
jgi:NAD(P)-dependent dehydrogenase (short-subunit alcohol dehydrogenase family)